MRGKNRKRTEDQSICEGRLENGQMIRIYAREDNGQNVRIYAREDNGQNVRIYERED